MTISIVNTFKNILWMQRRSELSKCYHIRHMIACLELQAVLLFAVRCFNEIHAEEVIDSYIFERNRILD